MPAKKPPKQDRTQFIGASEVSALFGCNPFKKPIDIFNDKMGLTSESKRTKTKLLADYTEIGIGKFFAYEYMNAKSIQGFQEHIRKGVIGATLDFVAVDGKYKGRKFDFAPLDVKTIGFTGELPYHSKYGKGGTEEVPLHVYYQIQQQLYIFNENYPETEDCRDGFVGVLSFIGNGARLYRLEYKREIGMMLEEVATDFWNKHILTKTPPSENQLSFTELSF